MLACSQPPAKLQEATLVLAVRAMISCSACASADLGAPRDGAIETIELVACEMTESKAIYSTTSERGCNQEDDMLDLDTVWLYILYCSSD